ncbi:MAG: hypothetical protein FWD00_04975 [Clostridiales bacterium]|nr:hypothetical protein [Clostridiales bacterium]
MDQSKYKPSFIKRILPYLIFVAVFVAVLLFVLTGLREAQAASYAEELRIAEKSIRRAVISSYASTGKYPPTFEHLVEHYGIKIDQDRFVVHYNVFATNIMPDIVVLRAGR